MTRARELARLGNENVLSVEDDSLEVGINSTKPASTLDVAGQLNVGTAIKAGVAGVITATEFSGSIGTFSGAGSFGGNLDVTGNVTVGGTLTYEDVTNIDSVGIITAQTGVRVTAGGLVVTAGVTTITDDLKVNSTLTATEGINVSAGVGTFAGNVSIADKIIHTGDTNTALRFPSADTVTVETSGSEAIRVDSSQRLVVGATSSNNVGGFGGAALQVEGLTAPTSAMSIIRHSNDAVSPSILMGKSRGTSDGATTIVQDDDVCARIIAYGADGNDTESSLGAIQFDVDGTPGSNDMPGRIVFSTTPDGAATYTEKLRITSAGLVGIGSDAPTHNLDVVSSSNPYIKLLRSGYNPVYIGNAAGEGVIETTGATFIKTGGSERLRIDSSGRLLIGTTSTVNSFTDTVQIFQNTSTAAITVKRASNNAYAPYFNFIKSRGSTNSAATVLQSDDIMGYIRFSGTDGTDTAESAVIQGVVDGTPGDNDMPGRLSFFTTADGAQNATERLRIDSSGRLLVGGTGNTESDVRLYLHNPSAAGSQMQITGSGSGTGNSDGLRFGYNGSGAQLWLFENEYLRFATNNTERLRIDSDGRVMIGQTSSVVPFMVTATASNFGGMVMTGVFGDDTSYASGVGGGLTLSGKYNSGGSQVGFAAIRGLKENGTDGDYGGLLTFNTRPNGSNMTESMRILSNQSICMGGSLQAGANGGVNIESTSSGSKPVGLSLINQGTADDSGFTVSYRGKDDAGNQEDFAYLKFTAQDTANGSEDGNLEIWTAKGGTITKSAQFGPGKPNQEPTAFFIMDSTATGADSEACVRLTNLDGTAYNWCTAEFAVNNSVQWKAGCQRHGAGAGADFFLINNGNDRFRVGENGKIRSPYTYSGTTTGGGPIYVESDGDFLRYTSSRKYKTDIETLEDARADNILNCRPVWYKSLSENDIKTPGADKSDWGWYGFIAEEVAEIEPRLVNWATKDAGTNPGDGFATVERDPSKYTAEGVRYDNFVPLLVNLVKRQKAEIESLKARLDAAGL